MSLLIFILSLLCTLWNLYIGLLINIVALIVCIVELKRYKSIGKISIIFVLILLEFQIYFVIKRTGEFNSAKIKNAKSTINYLRKSADLYYMSYFYETGEVLSGNIVFVCDGKKCFNKDTKLDIVGTIPSSGLIIISPSDNEMPNVTGKDIMIFDYICNFERFGDIDCIQK